MKTKLTFKEISTAGKTISWTIHETDNPDIFGATIIYDYKKKIYINAIPGTYVKEDNIKDAKQDLTKKEKMGIVDGRLHALFNTIQRCVFSCNLFGVKFEGYLKSITKPTTPAMNEGQKPESDNEKTDNDKAVA